MSKDYNNICNKILQSNKDIHTEAALLQEFNKVQNDMKKLSSKIDQIYKLLLIMRDERDNY